MAGDLAAAEAMYGQLLAADPGNPDALHLLGVVHLQSDRCESARDLLLKAVAGKPGDPEFRANLGAAFQKLQRYDEALEQYRAALALNPRLFGVHTNMAAAQKRLGRPREAVESYRAALRLDPSSTRVQRLLGELHLDQGQYAEARACFEALLRLAGNDADAHNKLGYAEEKLGRAEAAEAAYRRALDLRPDVAQYYSNVALMARQRGAADEAQALLERACELAPGEWRLAANLSGIYLDRGEAGKSVAILRRLLRDHPDEAMLWNGLGMALRQANDLAGAQQALLKAIELDPDYPEPHANLSLCFASNRNIEAAVAALREMLRRRPRNLFAHLSLAEFLCLLHRYDEANVIAHAAMMLEDYRPVDFGFPLKVFSKTCDFDGIAGLGDIWAASESVLPDRLPAMFLDMLPLTGTPAQNDQFLRLHRKWAKEVTRRAALNPLPPLETGKRTGRVRIGLLSSDLRSHSVAKFALPLLENYDRDRFDIFCYAPYAVDADPVQQRIRSLVSKFTVLPHTGDRDLAAAIRADQVDILIELNGFTQDTRLPAVAYRPAPVQVSWLGYPFSNGLPQMDYIIVDRFARPLRDELLVERPLELAGSWACFGALEDVSIAEAPPCEANGFVTFGTLNSPYKYQPGAVALWARIMRQVPDSRFLIIRPDDGSRVLCHHLVAEFEKHGISGDRLFLLKNQVRQHLPHYNQIDVSLDTFPLTGGTTTCDALWMGVPVVSLRGESFHQRLSHSYLNHAGLGDLSCETEEDYVRTAVALAADRARLRHLRRTLRPFLMDSDLCRGDRFAAHFQDAMMELVRRHGLR